MLRDAMQLLGLRWHLLAWASLPFLFLATPALASIIVDFVDLFVFRGCVMGLRRGGPPADAG